ncbi:MAG: amidohydrolase [Planctomycetota bacterium]|nr:MAG: amidohydrolase [Planctomycetota bacterium]
MLRRAALTLCLCSAALLGIARAEPPAEWAKSHMSELLDIYRDLHQAPELSLQEEKTAAKVATFWEEAGAEVTTGVGGTGVVGIMKNGNGPVLMLRTDLDALPVTERTGLVYSSKVKVKNTDGSTTGVMHACGHDIHMTDLIGVAQYLGSHKDDWSGTVMLIAQPAEERGEGARNMLNDGLFERFPKPDMALALHVDATLETGKIGYRAGYSLANVDAVDVTMRGRGGHGAQPHTTIDPIVQAAQLIVALQTIVSREISPIEPAVITVGSIHGGTKHNVIPDDCHLQLTVRSFSDETRTKLLDGIRRKAKAIADSVGAPEPEVTVVEDEATPALFNDEKLVARVAPVLKRVLGEENVVDNEPSMGGEDFSRYGRAGVPIFMFSLGSVDPHRMAGLKRTGAVPSLHSAVYYPDAEQTLQTGITAMASAALDLLAPEK